MRMRFPVIPHLSAQRVLYGVFGSTVVAAVVLFGARYLVSSYAVVSTAPLTLDDLPAQAVFIPHPEDVRIAEELGKIPMTHYATPEAARAGGPIYGSYGYGIVAIEYEIPLAAVGARAVGDVDPGYLLSLPEIAGAMRTIPYDHFHIGYSQHSHGSSHSHEGGRQSDDDETLIIHFMLISHEQEEEIGLYCG